MTKIWIVARWEFLKNLKLKQEIIGYLVMLALYGALFAVQYWQQQTQQQKVELAVAGEVPFSFSDRFNISTLPDNLTVVEYQRLMAEESLAGILLKTQESSQYQLLIPNEVSWRRTLESELQDYERSQLLHELAMSQEQLEKLENPLDLEVINSAEQQVGEDAKLLSSIVAILTAIAVFNSFALCMTSVTQEKQHRVTEQLLTCINFQQWIDGKAIGLCLSSIKSLISTLIIMVLIFSAVSIFSPGNEIDLSLSDSPLAMMVLFCILGIVFWNYVFVGFSATIDDPNHSGKTGLMLLPMLPVMLVFMVLDDPAGEVATILSMIPLTAISFMPMRMASMEVPFWQISLSFIAMVAGIWLVRLYASRIFRANITLFGKEPTWYQMWKNMRNKSL
ncbi:ABC transporter permease [Planctobacterium marinum]|uniref:ABC-2 type transporter transmembrane domain-containing protein n=1 Tax=Planctobacterium marinum TaxID=1631968 RepID=A0AA48HSW4_9ALTE|nr:hypothetical protein MACH26_07540 [Planctobacterium marinum]